MAATAIAADSLTAPTSLTAGTSTPDTTNYSGIISGTQASTPTSSTSATANTGAVDAGNSLVDNAAANIGSDEAAVNTGNATASTDVGNITSLETQDENKAVDTQNELDSTGATQDQADINTYNGQLDTINANIAGLANEAKAIPLEVQNNAANTGSTDAGVAPQQTGMLRDNAIKALTQSSLASALQASISGSTLAYNTAVDKANQAISLKYAPIEQEISDLKDQLTLNKDNITDPAEAKLAADQTTILNERASEIADQKQTETNVSNIALEAAKNGASMDTITAIQNSPDELSAIKAAGTSLTTPTTDVENITAADGSTQTVLINKTTGAILKNLTQSVGGNSDNMPTSVVQTVPAANGTVQAVTGVPIQAGEDPYTIAQQNGLSMDALKALNPQITDWTTIQPNTVINVPDSDNSFLNGKTPAQVAAYNGLDDNTKADVQQLVTGGALLSDLSNARGTGGKLATAQLLAAVQTVDPTFSANQNKEQYQYQTQFNDPNSTTQKTITSINTGLQHLSDLATAAKALNNGKIIPANQFENYLSKNTGNPAVTNFNAIADALAGEMDSIYSGGSPSIAGTANWKNSILSDYSRSQISGVANTMSTLVSGKLSSLGSSYKNIMGMYPASPLVSTSSLQALQEAGVDTTGIESTLTQQGYNVPDNPTSTGSNYSYGGMNLNLPTYGGSGSSSSLAGAIWGGYQLNN